MLQLNVCSAFMLRSAAAALAISTQLQPAAATLSAHAVSCSEHRLCMLQRIVCSPFMLRSAAAALAISTQLQPAAARLSAHAASRGHLPIACSNSMFAQHSCFALLQLHWLSAHSFNQQQQRYQRMQCLAFSIAL